eukprot:scaffold109158_cov40-Attheya_sp.AAC.1
MAKDGFDHGSKCGLGIALQVQSTLEHEEESSKRFHSRTPTTTNSTGTSSCVCEGAAYPLPGCGIDRMTQRDVHGRREIFKIVIKAPASGMFAVLAIAHTRSLGVPIGRRQRTPDPIPPHNLEERDTEVAREGIPLEEDVGVLVEDVAGPFGCGRDGGCIAGSRNEPGGMIFEFEGVGMIEIIVLRR